MAVEIVAEVGINHNGSMRLAKECIREAAGAGVDFIKFQKRTPELAVPRDQWGLPKETQWGTIPYLDYKRRMELGREQYMEIQAYCMQEGVGWFFSVWDLEALDFCSEFSLPYVKIPSAKLTDLDLIRAAGGTGQHVILSTGMSTEEQIIEAVKAVGEKCSLTVMHCHSAYPAPVEELNLSYIPRLIEMGKGGASLHRPFRVGYSGHSYGIQPTTWAVILGAQMVEMHITPDRTLWGTDQMASVEPLGFARLVRHVRDAEKALGDGVKKVWDSELPHQRKLRGGD